MRFPSATAAVLLAAFSFCGDASAQLDFDRKPIEYADAPVDDAIERLRQAIDAGQVTLKRDERLGWLPAVLEALGVPPSSQTLVFSKTSLQRRRIDPSRPRALYFSDDVYVGYVRFGKQLELSAVDDQQGAVFYTIDQWDRERPKIERDNGACISCHATRRTQSVPGYLVRSVFVDDDGEIDGRFGGLVTDHTTPFEDRFGGWYVTGSHGEMRHRGNVIAVVDEDAIAHAEPRLDREAGANRPTLDGLVDTSRYLQPGSDLIALMVLEHQTQVHNLITRLNYQARIGAYYDDAINRVSDQPPGTQSDGTRRRIASACEELLQHLLFSGEAPLDGLLDGPIAGTSTFAEDFAAHGPRDEKGRSLRDFDLTTRLFRFPCSFLIYSPSIDALPGPARERFRQRLTEVLTGEDKSPPFAHLTAADRQAILEILRETKPERLAL